MEAVVKKMQDRWSNMFRRSDSQDGSDDNRPGSEGSRTVPGTETGMLMEGSTIEGAEGLMQRAGGGKYEERGRTDETLRTDATLESQGREESYAFSHESQPVENLHISQEFIQRGGEKYEERRREEATNGRQGYRDHRGQSQSKSLGTLREGIGHDSEIVKQLQDLLQMDSSAVIENLVLPSGISTLLEDGNIAPGKMLLIVALLAKACGSKTSPRYIIDLMVKIHNSKFYDHVSAVFAEITRSLTIEERIKFVSDVLSYLIELFTRLPHSYLDPKVLEVERLLKEELNHTEIFENKGQILERFSELQHLKVAVQENIEEKQRAKTRNQDVEPPGDFREISILPTMEDLQPDERPFLRKSKVRGGYIDLNHYLDVQFRLLREDFIAPLREGINQYVLSEGSGKGKRKTDIRVYNNVQVTGTLCSETGLQHRLRFNVRKFGRVRWENSKRLIFGSLVCLSNDNFQTFFFATVSARDPKMLKQGYIDVLIESTETSNLNSEFVMVETTAFFEAYRHVLRGLQLVKEGYLPFEKYIVCCYTQVNPPMYLLNKPGVKYDLRPLVDKDSLLREDAALERQGREVSYAFSQESQPVENLHIFQDQEWPPAELLHFDESQKKALKTALTKEFTIIQGPPGTGKTYVGLKIVNALLHNSKVWNSGRKSPMLIVCYTNHALDQFLLGIISFFKGRLVRVGSKITIDVMKRYSLKGQKQTSDETVMKTLRKQMYDHRVSMLSLQLEIEKSRSQLEAAETSIFHEDCLRPYMKRHYDSMLTTMKLLHANLAYQRQEKMPWPESFMKEWLGLGNDEDMFYMLQQTSDRSEWVEDEDEDEDVISVSGEAEIEQNKRRIDDLDTPPLDKPKSEMDMLKKKIDNLKRTKSEYVTFDVSTFKGHTAKQGEYEFQKHARKNMKRQLLGRIRSTKRMTDRERWQVNDPWHLPMEDRWRLYHLWVHEFCDRLRNDIDQKENRYKMLVSKLNEMRMFGDKHIFEDASVIGMTTTAAARYQQVLTEIGPKIVVVEEAAEVFEGHIITTLSKKCEHLILIGDHKQLKPNPTVYELARKYNLDLSLFERMVDNGIHCDTLALQHRMRPEISSIVRHIYPHLQDHPCVSNYEQVKGISHNMFFINHKNPEEHDNDLFSHSNEYEAEYMAALCKYLLKQGYERSQITVLTTYSGQLFKLRKLMPKSEFEGVHVTVVDNYQGEENDIILLSLVRSNQAGSVGFLKIENRVCVALSRAKIGLFVIGNIELLAEKSPLWSKIWIDLKKNGRIGSTLNLYCQNHIRDDGLSINSPDDFKRAPEGGCLKPCEFRLDCGHVCRLCCHPYDQDHEEYECTEPCEQKMSCEMHGCTKLCFQECGNCLVLVEKILPKCGHNQMVPCHMSPDEVSCRSPCEVILPCGHLCGKKCGEKHRCREKVTKLFRCGHKEDVFCERKDEAECQTKCPQILKCGHICIGKCSTCNEGRLHSSCNKKCEKILICSHKCENACSTCPPCMKACENHCPHRKCEHNCHEACKPCLEPCSWKCEHNKCTKRCDEPCDRPPCDQPCQRKLRCKHPCIGICGEPCPPQCRICNKDDLLKLCSPEELNDSKFVLLKDCSHIVEVSKLDRYMATASSKFILKGCPYCKTPIQHHVRYWNSIREVRNNIEQVKLRFQSKVTDDKKAKLMRNIENTEDEEVRKDKRVLLHQGFTHSMSGLFAIENMLSFDNSLRAILVEYAELDVSTHRPDDLENTKQMIKEANNFKQFVRKPRWVFTEQEESDCQSEIFRHKAAIRMLKHQLESFQAGSSEKTGVLKGILLSGKPLTEDNARVTKECLQELMGPRFVAARLDDQVMTVHYPDLRPECWTTCKQGHVIAHLDEERCVKCLQKEREEEEERLWFAVDDEDEEDLEMKHFLDGIEFD